MKRTRPAEKAAPRKKPCPPLTIRLVSFGHRKRRIPPNDRYIDLQSGTPLRNPYRDPRNGLDPALQAIVFGTKQARAYRDRSFNSILSWLTVSSGDHPLTIAVGCHGGQHRSVSFCAQLQTFLEGMRQFVVTTEHLELQEYEVIGLRGDTLRLCPAVPGKVERIVEVQVDTAMVLNQIPDLPSKYLKLCGEPVTGGTTVSALRRDMIHRSTAMLYIAEVVRVVAKSLLPLCRYIWDTDVSAPTSDRRIKMCFENADDTLDLKLFVSEGDRLTPKEMEFLCDLQKRFLLAYSENYLSVWCMGDYSYVEVVYWRQTDFREISVTANPMSSNRTRGVSLELDEKLGGCLEWTWTQTRLPWSSMSAHITGKTTWERGIPPLSPSFRKDCLNGHPYLEDRRDEPEVPSLKMLCIAQLRRKSAVPLSDPVWDIVLFGLEKVGLTSEIKKKCH